MSFLSSPEPEPERRRPIVVFLLVALLAAGGVTFWILRRPAPASAPTPHPSARATPRPAPSARPAATPEPRESTSSRTVSTPRAARLHVESDIPGAQVFVDRKYLGTTPLDCRDLESGAHSLNVSVEGHDPHVETIEIGEEPLRVTVRFREVKLEEALLVIHRHGVGSCQGRLKAMLDGLTYEPSGGSHGFHAAFDTVERFEVDYLKKNLRTTLRGGRTYNFTIDGENADPLLVFQRKVDAARRRLASGT